MTDQHKDICLNCTNQTGTHYMIAQSGEVFCSEDCLESYMESTTAPFDPHPYEDQYLGIRRAYIEMLDTWEAQMSAAENNLESKADSLYEEIDEIIDDYCEFVLTEGDDGAYAWEIYQYTNKLKELQRQVFAWRPQRNTYYWISSDTSLYGSLTEEEEEIFHRISTDLYLAGYEEFFLYIFKKYHHPYHDGHQYVFDIREMAEEALEILRPVFEKHVQSIELIEAYRCEGHCGDIVDQTNESCSNGWLYCCSCYEQEDVYGIYSSEQLQDIMAYYEKEEVKRQVVIHEREDWCYAFKGKVKRSCRKWDISIPDWAY